MNKDVKRILEQIRQRSLKDHATGFFNNFDRSEAGTGMVINYLYDVGGSVTAGNISKNTNISTARTAVILKKLVDKGYIEKSTDKNDARKAVICLTAKGKSEVEDKRLLAESLLQKIIEKIGEERFTEYLDLSFEIRKIILETGNEHERSKNA